MRDRKNYGQNLKGDLAYISDMVWDAKEITEAAGKVSVAHLNALLDAIDEAQDRAGFDLTIRVRRMSKEESA